VPSARMAGLVSAFKRNEHMIMGVARDDVGADAGLGEEVTDSGRQAHRLQCGVDPLMGQRAGCEDRLHGRRLAHRPTPGFRVTVV